MYPIDVMLFNTYKLGVICSVALEQRASPMCICFDGFLQGSSPSIVIIIVDFILYMALWKPTGL
jgi:hypothetical protein